MVFVCGYLLIDVGNFGLMVFGLVMLMTENELFKCIVDLLELDQTVP